MHSDITAYIKSVVSADLARVSPEGLRVWISERLVEPYITPLAVDPEGTQFQEFWIVSDHKGKKGYRIAYSPDDDSFGIVTSLQNDIEWYMGDYGSFKKAAESL